MSIIEPKIDVLLDKTDNDRFLLCALASKRAHDINDMMRGQRDRAIQLQTAVEIARAASRISSRSRSHLWPQLTRATPGTRAMTSAIWHATS